MASNPLLRLSRLPPHHPTTTPSPHPLPPPFPSPLLRSPNHLPPTRLRAQAKTLLLPESPNNLPRAAPTAPRRKPTTTCAASSSSSYNRGGSTTPAALERLVSAAAYLLPLLKGLSYGRFLFAKYPGLAAALEPVLPLLNLYHSIPYASLVSFVALYLGVARNPRLSRYVRFNAMQAVVLNVFLAFPSLFQLIFSPARSGLGYKLTVMVYEALFIFIVCCFVYSVVCCILGRTPYLPLVAEAADRQV